MIWLSRALIGIIGFSGGVVISAAVFALVTSTGMMARLAARTDTRKYVLAYETAVILGGTLSNIMYVFYIGNDYKLTQLPSTTAVRIIISIMMLFGGMFVGCLAVSLSEAIKATAIFNRRLRINQGICYMILALTVGKSLAVLFQFTVGPG